MNKPPGWVRASLFRTGGFVVKSFEMSESVIF